MAEKRFVVLRKHARNCTGMQPQNHPDRPWCAIPAKDFGNGKEFDRGDGFMLGSKISPLAKGHTQWLVVICNSLSCKGRIALNMDAVLSKAPPGGLGRSNSRG